MAGLGCKIGETVVGFDDFSPEAWERVNRSVNWIVISSDEEGNEVRATWLDIYAMPMRDPAAARIVHEEAVRAAEPGCPDVGARSRELAPSIKAVSDSFTVVDDDLPPMVDGAPMMGSDGRPLDDPSTPT